MMEKSTILAGRSPFENSLLESPRRLPSAFLHRMVSSWLLPVLIATMPLMANCQEQKDDSLLTAFLLVYASNPCNFQARPQLSAVSPSVTNVWPTVKGRVLQANGDPAIAALVIVQDSDTDGASDGPGKRFVSTFTGLNGDGSFYMAGLPNVTDQYRISVEPIDPQYDGRIDTHIDCFQNPASFSPGYYTGPSSTINSNTGSAQTFQLNPNTSQLYDAGDILLR